MEVVSNTGFKRIPLVDKTISMVVILIVLEDTARHVGLLLAPAEGFDLRPRLSCSSGQKKRAYYAVLAHFWHFLCLVVTLVTLSSNLSNFERIPPPQKKKIKKKSKKNQKKKKKKKKKKKIKKNKKKNKKKTKKTKKKL